MEHRIRMLSCPRSQVSRTSPILRAAGRAGLSSWMCGLQMIAVCGPPHSEFRPKLNRTTLTLPSPTSMQGAKYLALKEQRAADARGDVTHGPNRKTDGAMSSWPTQQLDSAPKKRAWQLSRKSWGRLAALLLDPPKPETSKVPTPKHGGLFEAMPIARWPGTSRALRGPGRGGGALVSCQGRIWEGWQRKGASKGQTMQVETPRTGRRRHGKPGCSQATVPSAKKAWRSLWAGASLGLAVPQWQGAGILGAGTMNAVRGQALRGALIQKTPCAWPHHVFFSQKGFGFSEPEKLDSSSGSW